MEPPVNPVSDVTPPGAWRPAQRAVRAALRPIEAFLHVEAAGSVLLMVAAAIALVLASSPLAELYQHLLEIPVALQLGAMRLEVDLHFVVNEVLMTLFFFTVGLEIRREIAFGELSELRRAALPICAALGGMAAPAGIYLLVAGDGPARSGWGVPMATDIAFAVGVLMLLGKRVSPALRVLLLTIAIVDDIGAVLVIAFFYSQGVAWTGLAVAAAGVLAVVALQKIGARSVALFVVPGVVVWEGLHQAGVHPTLAGVILGLLTPARAWIAPRGLAEIAARALDRVQRISGQAHPDAADLDAPLRELGIARREAISPVERLNLALHPWVAWLIMPVFAFANAGVPLGSIELGGASGASVLGIVLGLGLGKPIGIALGAALIVATRIAPLPRGVTWGGIAVVGVVAGIGFTMAIFIADLAFDAALLRSAKVAILGASVLTGVAAYVIGRVLLPRTAAEGAALSESDAESSTVS
jgi:NhaA family Na+:H+ antiporter